MFIRRCHTTLRKQFFQPLNPKTPNRRSNKPGSDGFRAIVFVGALESFIPTFEHGVYAASKYAVRALAETLHVELAPHPHIRVSLFCPSRARTNLQAVEEVWFLSSPLAFVVVS
jgi:short-subunit dehydrogenase